MQTAARFSSSSTPKRVLVGISNSITRAAFRSRGKSHTASVQTDPLKAQKGQKKIPKQERRALIEAFVENYRALNGGKFPSAYLVREGVGGSYYIVREIIQELEYNHKMAPLDKFKTAKPSGTVVKGDPSFADREKPQNSSSQGSVRYKEMIAEKMETDQDSLFKSDQIVEKVQFSNNARNISTEEPVDLVSTEDSIGSLNSSMTSTFTDSSQQNQHSSSLKLETVIETSHSSSEEAEHNRTKVSTSQEPNSPKGDELSGGRGVSESNELHSKQLSEHANEESSLPTTNIWGNLKSFANGIINLWKQK
ncbi:hypothetical protein ACMD2_10217 [Ananas comosus]|uniref:AT3G52170-like helix-turn-helix domain-containing protein n=1 Tax=Ananas comosus TaxID=4615 RepID=A0A199VZB7_ANACO|nr:hypothetical protein ACMD2_10217 [Ananas comosus]